MSSVGVQPGEGIPSVPLRCSPRIRLGMGQLLVEGGEPERNLGRAEHMIALAAEKGCSLIVLPECLDLAWTHPSAFDQARSIPGPYCDRLCNSAAANGLWICAGLTERSDSKRYNTAVLIGPEGEIVLKYRKINLLIVEQPFYAVGQSLGVVETCFGVIGVDICSDNYADALDLGSALGRMGAQIILTPCSWTVDYSVLDGQDPYGEKWLGPYRTLAQLFDLAVVSATSVGVIVGGPYEGKKMVGCSLAVGRSGVIARGPYNEFAGELVVAELDVPSPHAKGTAIAATPRQKGACL